MIFIVKNDPKFNGDKSLYTYFQMKLLGIIKIQKTSVITYSVKFMIPIMLMIQISNAQKTIIDQI
jgi:hypothetical protein